jgi:hypothetical protein
MVAGLRARKIGSGPARPDYTSRFVNPFPADDGMANAVWVVLCYSLW